MNVRVEEWMGYKIRFVEKSFGEWWAVAKDVSEPLNYSDSRQMTRYMDTDEISAFNWKNIQTANLADCFLDYKYKKDVPIISETGIYEAVLNSKNKDAKDFKKWVKQMLKYLRQMSGLEGFQVFRVLDKEHQKEAMDRLKTKLREPARPDFIKANTIANKAVSSMYGHPKMIKKEQMTADMLVNRQDILDDTVNLMAMSDRFNLNIPISDTIYGKYLGDRQRDRHAN